MPFLLTITMFWSCTMRFECLLESAWFSVRTHRRLWIERSWGLLLCSCCDGLCQRICLRTAAGMFELPRGRLIHACVSARLLHTSLLERVLTTKEQTNAMRSCGHCNRSSACR